MLFLTKLQEAFWKFLQLEPDVVKQKSCVDVKEVKIVLANKEPFSETQLK